MFYTPIHIKVNNEEPMMSNLTWNALYRLVLIQPIYGTGFTIMIKETFFFLQTQLF